MKVLDFYKNQFDSLNASIPWEKSILEFLKNWESDSDQISVQTSGSTGIPKLICLPKKAMKKSAQMTCDFFDLQPGQVAVLALPSDFIAGKMMLVRAMERKLKLVCIEPKSQLQFPPDLIFDFVPLTPMQVENSLEILPQIKNLLIGGAPLSKDLRAKLMKLETASFESYGMTETITHIALKEISEDFFTVLQDISIRQDARDCLVIQTPYFSEEIITNDLVDLVNEKSFKWLGRYDNVINSGGIKLFPEQIESKLKTQISTEFIISSIHDDILGQKLILIIEGEKPTENRAEFTGLGKFEIPKEIYYLAKFPRTENGKLLREKIKELI